MFLLKKELIGSKPFFIMLQSLFGIGQTYALYLCSRVGASVKAYLKDISYRKVRVLGRLLTQEGIFEIELSRLVQADIKNKIAIRCYVGQRHLMRLPVRGQNTKNNRQTAKKLLGNFRK
jgi:small subunit ribosomal protein S13